jgi:hypothetical protein
MTGGSPEAGVAVEAPSDGTDAAEHRSSLSWSISTPPQLPEQLDGRQLFYSS